MVISATSVAIQVSCAFFFLLLTQVIIPNIEKLQKEFENIKFEL